MDSVPELYHLHSSYASVFTSNEFSSVQLNKFLTSSGDQSVQQGLHALPTHWRIHHPICVRCITVCVPGLTSTSASKNGLYRCLNCHHPLSSLDASDDADRKRKSKSQFPSVRKRKRTPSTTTSNIVIQKEKQQQQRAQAPTQAQIPAIQPTQAQTTQKPIQDNPKQTSTIGRDTQKPTPTKSNSSKKSQSPADAHKSALKALLSKNNKKKEKDDKSSKGSGGGLRGFLADLE